MPLFTRTATQETGAYLDPMDVWAIKTMLNHVPKNKLPKILRRTMADLTTPSKRLMKAMLTKGHGVDTGTLKRSIFKRAKYYIGSGIASAYVGPNAQVVKYHRGRKMVPIRYGNPLHQGHRVVSPGAGLGNRKGYNSGAASKSSVGRAGRKSKNFVEGIPFIQQTFNQERGRVTREFMLRVPLAIIKAMQEVAAK